MSDDLRLTPEQIDVLKKAVSESVGSQYRKQAETDLQKEIANRIKEEIGVEPKLYKRLVSIAYKSDAARVNAETVELLDLAEELGLYSHEE